MRLKWIIALLSAVLSLACGQGPVGPGNNGNTNVRATQRLLIELDQLVVFPTSILTFRMKGSDGMVPHEARVYLDGTDANGAEIAFEAVVQPAGTKGFPRSEGDHGDVLVQLRVSDGLWTQVAPAPTATVTGGFRLELVDEIGVVGDGVFGDTFRFFADATPTVQGVPGGEYSPNEEIRVNGANFLRPEEGTTFATINGVFIHEDTTLGEKPVQNQRLPLKWTGRRDEAAFIVDANVFGVRPGTFSGSLSFVNELSNLQSFPGNSQPSFAFTQQQPHLGQLVPPAGSRGQRIEFVGAGFVPQDDASDLTMIFEFDGTFTYDSGESLDLTGANSLPRVADNVVSGTSAEMAVWYEIRDGELFGLGANPGVFDGTITPVFQDEFGDYRGIEWQGTFRVLPTKQMVYIKYLPGFSKGLEKYGLQNVEFEIRQRILHVTNRDYDGLNVEFVDRPPTQFLEFATVEIGGPDPTGGGKFGYDNTCNSTEQKCKDTKNLFLGDYLGGVNTNSEDQFNTPYGGIFIESFDFFSPTLNPDNTDASPDFDRIMSPFMPALGGDPVKATEYPGGLRDQLIDQAIHMVGSVVGNTCTHEIGHSLGLAFFPQDLLRPGESFHNKIPGENYIMDPGSERPFVERGEINGAGPAKFNSANAAYLKDILPLP